VPLRPRHRPEFDGFSDGFGCARGPNPYSHRDKDRNHLRRCSHLYTGCSGHPDFNTNAESDRDNGSRRLCDSLLVCHSDPNYYPNARSKLDIDRYVNPNL